MLFLTRKPRQKIILTLDTGTVVTLLVAGTRDGVVKLGIDAPRHCRIRREEVPDEPDERGS